MRTIHIHFHDEAKSKDGSPPSQEAIEYWNVFAPADLRKHPMWSASDYAYFREKGYTDAQVKAFWDRDLKARPGRGPVNWK